MNILPSDVIIYLAQFLDRQCLASLVQTSRRYHTLLTECLYDSAIQVIDPSGITVIYPDNISVSLQPWIGYRIGVMERAGYWATEPVITYFTTKALDLVMSPFIYHFIPATSLGKTIIHECAEAGNTQLVNVLLARGVDVNVKTRGGLTPLHYAVTGKSNLDTVLLLLCHGANGHAQTAGGEPILCAASGHATEDILGALIKAIEDARGDIFRPDSQGCTPIHWAARYGNVSATRMLLQCGANIMAENVAGELALHEAARCRSVEACQLVFDATVAAGGKPFQPNHEGKTPLHCAIQAAQLESARLFIAHGASAVATDQSGISPLGLALEKLDYVSGMKSVIQAMIDTRPSTWPTAELQVALWDANMRRNFDALSFILDLQEKFELLDINSLDHEGRTILHNICAANSWRWHERCEMIKRLVLLGAQAVGVHTLRRAPIHALLMAPPPGPKPDTYYDALSVVIDSSAVVGARDCYGDTALHYAAMKGDVRAVRLILAKTDAVKAVINCKNNIGWSALHYAAEYGYRDIIRLLASSGAMISERAHDGKTPLHLAAALAGGTDISPVRLLVELGADPTSRCNGGYSPSHYAAAVEWDHAVGYLTAFEESTECCDNCRRRTAPWRLHDDSQQEALQQMWKEDAEREPGTPVLGLLF